MRSSFKNQKYPQPPSLMTGGILTIVPGLCVSFFDLSAELLRDLEDDSIPISNNFAENAARPYAVGRKNFLFHNSTDGADTSAAIYSIVESAKRNGLNVMDRLN